jgi:hypothetical protein
MTAATSAVVLTETRPPALVGVLFLADTTRPGLTPLAAAVFLVAVVSAVTLARFGEAEHPPEHPPGHPPGHAEAGNAPRQGLA